MLFIEMDEHIKARLWEELTTTRDTGMTLEEHTSAILHHVTPD